MQNTKNTVVEQFSRYVERCQPYRVQMACGHIETRMMREATAGIPWSETATVKAGAACAPCRGRDR